MAGGAGRVVLFPSPFVGHIHPMLHLASLLHSLGRFTITIIHTIFNPPDASSYPHFQFIPIQDGLNDDDGCITISEDYMELLITLNANCAEPFKQEMRRLLDDDRAGKVVCLIADAHLYLTREVAEELKVPRIVFRTSGAANFRAFSASQMLWKKGCFPIPDEEQDSPVPDMPQLRFRDLPEFNKSTPDSTHQVLTEIITSTRTSNCMIINTYEELEQSDIHKLQSDLRVPVIPIGPLHKLSTSSLSSSFLTEKHLSSKLWLNQQRPNSVLYVSFGSLACMDIDELMEVAWGLANSQLPFLWALRLGSVRGLRSGSAWECKLREFEEVTGGRGRVVQWASQVEVLRHPSVGGFWTHCGWNSVLESICEGVPMLCSPSFGDQMGNARLVSHVWKVGINLGSDGMERVEIERGIKELMIGGGLVEMRRRAMRLKEDADFCLGHGGSFHASLEKLLRRVVVDTD